MIHTPEWLAQNFQSKRHVDNGRPMTFEETQFLAGVREKEIILMRGLRL